MHHAWLFSQIFAKQKISLSWLYLALNVLNLKTFNQKLLNVLSFLEYLQLLIFYHKCFLKQLHYIPSLSLRCHFFRVLQNNLST